MNSEKEKLLYSTYEKFLGQGLGRTNPDKIDDIVSQEIMGFGSTVDEKIFGIEGLLKLIKIQREQTAGLDMIWEIEPVNRYVNSDENLAVFADDIGRVLLNLYNNAFYAVNKRRDAMYASDSERTYQPIVSVKTLRINDKVIITVSDNGNGIPQSIVDKIFQPFYTTKPTGQGTGLGLSLSYDIVKAHGGEIKVESVENQGTTFIIQLPS